MAELPQAGVEEADVYAARALLKGSDIAREAFGPDVVEHYLSRARIELDAHEAAVTAGRSTAASSASDGH